MGRRRSSAGRAPGIATIVTLGVILAAGGCGSSTAELKIQAAEPTALAVTAEGTLRYGERDTGAIYQDRQSEPLATLEVSTDGQRGLLGLAVDQDGSTFAAWTRRSDLVLVVGQVAPGPVRLIWEGPETVSGANGGRILFDDDGSLLLTVGSLQKGSLIDDPDAVNGKLVRLNPAGPPEQEPTIISGGWHNPFSLAVTTSGMVWIADNDPGDDAERLAPAEGTATSMVTELPTKTAPSGMAALADGRLAVCSFLREEIQLYSPQPDGSTTAVGVIDVPCRLGVAALPDGRLAYATATGIDTVDVPDAPG